MSTDPQKDLFKRAAEIASVVPEPMQEAAFRRALDMLQDEAGTRQPSRRTPSRERRGSKRSANRSEADHEDPAEVLLQGIDRTKHPEVGEEPKVLERALHVLKIAKDEFDIDGLSSNEIARLLTDKFRVRTTRQRVNQVLDSAATLVDRTSGSGRRGARYRIMAPGEKHLATSPEERDDATPPPAPRAKSTPRKLQSRTARKSATRNAKAATQRRRLGPRPALEELLNDGYLDEPRTIGELRDRLESKKGRMFKVTDLSPALTRMLRDGSLDREKNEAGQYEYQRK